MPICRRRWNSLNTLIKKYYSVDVGLRNARLNYRQQELNSLLRIDDSFQKIVIVKEDIMPYRDNHGIYYTGVFQFLKTD